MKKNFIAFSLISLLLTCCGKSANENKDNIETKVQDEKPKNENLTKLELEASRLRAGGFIKTVILDGSSAKIEYLKDYVEPKILKPESSLSKSDFNSYWDSGDAVEKALVDGSVRIMKKLTILISSALNRFQLNMKLKKTSRFIKNLELSINYEHAIRTTIRTKLTVLISSILNRF
jgi:hypothetical protein